MSKTGSKPKKRSKTRSDAPIKYTKDVPAKTEGETPEEGKSTFEEELSWCLSQLDLGCIRKGATRKQKEYNQQVMKKLLSDKTVLPKKRQIMKNVFGDYRSKMATDPLPRPKEPTFIVEADSSPHPRQGSFYRLAVSEGTRKEGTKPVSLGNDGTEFSCHETHSKPSDFKFSFTIES